MIQRYPTMTDADRAALRAATLEWLNGPAVQAPLQEVLLQQKTDNFGHMFRDPFPSTSRCT